MTLKAELQPSSISLDGEATITITVQGSMSASEPLAPKVAGLSIIQTGKSTQIQIINGRMTTAAQYTFTVIADEAGSYTIPSFSVFSGGQEYKTRSLKLNVQSGSSYSSPPNQRQTPFPYSVQPKQRMPQAQPPSQNQPFWIVTDISNTTPVVNEQVLFRLKLFSRQTLTIEDIELPEFKEFYVKEVVHEKKSQEVIQGRPYNTYEIIYALFPLKPGQFKIDETRVHVKYFVNSRSHSRNLFDQFFNDPFFNPGAKAKRTVLKAESIAIQVEDLPKPIPEDFTNLVGRFGIRTELSEQEIQAGESLTYTVEISGWGNIKDANLPDFNFKDAKVYQDKPVLNAQEGENGITGSKTFKIAIVPKSGGEYFIPQSTLSYYDTETQQYETLNLESQSFTVTGNVAQQQTHLALTTPQNTSLESGNVENLSPLLEWEDFKPQQKSHFSGKVFWPFVIGMPGLFFLLGFIQLLKKQSQTPSKNKLQKQAFQNVMKTLGRKDASESELLNAFRDYFSYFHEREGKALTVAEMNSIMKEFPLSLEERSCFVEILSRLENAQYGFQKHSLDSGQKRELRKIFKQLAKI